MKKLLLVLAIGTFAACNSSSSDTTATDSTATDTTTMMAPAPTTVDTAAGAMSADTTHKMGADSTKMGADTTKSKK